MGQYENMNIIGDRENAFLGNATSAETLLKLYHDFTDKEILDITRKNYYDLKKKYEIVLDEDNNLKSEIDTLKIKFKELNEHFLKIAKELNELKNISGSESF